MRIKKKEVILPFRQTLAYRMLLLTGSAVVFIVSVYLLVGFLGVNMAAAISTGVIAAASGFGIFYNLDHMRDAKVPKQTLHRMKRR